MDLYKRFGDTYADVYEPCTFFVFVVFYIDQLWAVA